MSKKHTRRRSKIRILGLATVAVVGAAVLYAFIRRPTSDVQWLSSFSPGNGAIVTTVARIPFGDGTGSIARLRPVTPYWKPHSMLMHFVPVTVVEGDRIYVLQKGRLLASTSRGKIAVLPCPWATGYEEYMALGEDRCLWVAHGSSSTDDYNGVLTPLTRVGPGSKPLWGLRISFVSARLTKVGTDFKPLWVIKDRDSDEVQLNTVPVRKVIRNEKERISAVTGLFTARNGDVYLHCIWRMLRFSSEGKLLSIYPLNEMPQLFPPLRRVGSFYGAMVSRRGEVFSAPSLLNRSDRNPTVVPAGDPQYSVSHFPLEGFMLNIWQHPFERRSLVLNRTLAQPVGTVVEFRPAGVDGRGNLYFQSRYDDNADIVGRSYFKRYKNDPDLEHWIGPMVITKVNLKTKRALAFSVLEHYRAEIERAERSADKKRKERGPVGLGEVVHVSPEGDIYLEVADATHYRIDKITFPSG